MQEWKYLANSEQVGTTVGTRYPGRRAAHAPAPTTRADDPPATATTSPPCS